MSANKYAEHVLVLPEDDADNEFINGFLLETRLKIRCIQPLPVAGGWTEVRDEFENHQLSDLRKFTKRYFVMLVDFDGRADRRAEMMTVVPKDVEDRVFVVGVLTEPEDLKRDLKLTLEVIGQRLARECVEGALDLWRHSLLKHNESEVDRFRKAVWPFLMN